MNTRTAEMIDARTQHRPDSAAQLIDQALEICGTRAELAARCGVTGNAIYKLRKDERGMSYPMQALLEAIIKQCRRPLAR